jgi:hypothetical protein
MLHHVGHSSIPAQAVWNGLILFQQQWPGRKMSRSSMMRREPNGRFMKGERPSPELRAKMRAETIRHWAQRERSAEIAAEQARAEHNLELIRKELAELQALLSG